MPRQAKTKWSHRKNISSGKRRVPKYSGEEVKIKPERCHMIIEDVRGNARQCKSKITKTGKGCGAVKFCWRHMDAYEVPVADRYVYYSKKNGGPECKNYNQANEKERDELDGLIAKKHKIKPEGPARRGKDVRDIVRKVFESGNNGRNDTTGDNTDPFNFDLPWVKIRNRWVKRDVMVNAEFANYVKQYLHHAPPTRSEKETKIFIRKHMHDETKWEWIHIPTSVIENAQLHELYFINKAIQRLVFLTGNGIKRNMKVDDIIAYDDFFYHLYQDEHLDKKLIHNWAKFFYRDLDQNVLPHMHIDANQIKRKFIKFMEEYNASLNEDYPTFDHAEEIAYMFNTYVLVRQGARKEVVEPAPFALDTNRVVYIDIKDDVISIGLHK
eukprot:TRINITY_DN5557_c0_g3_i1.p1 TRINITY_DN5557_c0_g3~~TRINITY_DN5557_c0_g3_i1.p1  ORF type:complete len:383 (+),score=-0.51 TRINITY_DN5557_c0_g3_i1:872-2020(+)